VDSGGNPDVGADVGLEIGADLRPDQGAADGLDSKPNTPDGPDTAMDAKAARDLGVEVRSPMLKLVAGSLGGPGDLDGTGKAARFTYPMGVAFDGAGNLFVTDGIRNTVRKVVIATGAVTTLAGSPGISGSADGIGVDARFNYPWGVACDGVGNLFVADSNNHAIREIVLATGAVTTLAGSSGTSGWSDGVGISASFDFPVGVVVSSDRETLFVADAANDTIRRIALATGAVTTLAGSPEIAGGSDGIGADASFNFPYTLVDDGKGDLFVADSSNNTIRKVVVATREVTTLAGSPTGDFGSADGIGASALFNAPRGMAGDGLGNLFVTDSGRTIRKIVLAAEKVSTLAGSPYESGSADGTGATARFSSPIGIASDGSGDLFVADGDNGTIRKVVIATGEVTTFAGVTRTPGSADGTGPSARFDTPQAVASDGTGNLFVADSNNHTIRRVVIASGEVTTLAGLAGYAHYLDGQGSNARFDGPMGVASDGAGNLFVADSNNCTIRKIVIATADVTTFAGTTLSSGSTDGIGGAARFNFPVGLASDGAGNLFVADSNTIRKIVIATGEVTTLAGSPGKIGSTDGVGAAARFLEPFAVASDSVGNLFVADKDSNTIRQVVIATGAVTTLAGSPLAAGNMDGTSSAARFNCPEGMAYDGVGNLFVADLRNRTVRKIVIASGAVTTVVGTPGRLGVAPGPLPSSLTCPVGLAFAPSGNLFITDGCENVVLVAEF
jgi:sugar lactone lactonase YvrE